MGHARPNSGEVRTVLALVLLAASFAVASSKSAAEDRVRLPQDHAYQRVLRAYMAILKEQDFDHGVTEPITARPSSRDPEYQLRNYIMTMMQQPLVGSKRGTPAITAPSHQFLLSAIEGTDSVRIPPVWPEALIAFVEWDYPGNLYRDNRALKLRAFVTASVQMIMLDAHLDKMPNLRRSDWLGYQLSYLGSPYLGFKGTLPAEVRKTYVAGLRKLALRIIGYGPKEEEPNMDMSVPIGLWYVIQAVDDPAFTKVAQAQAKLLFTDPKYFHPAGYFVERGGCDLGFSGMTNYWTVWAALATDWPFARDAVHRAYRLRAHLALPEPDGTFAGPSQFNNRLGSPACEDQWHWDGARDQGAAMVTDEAAYLVKMPSEEQLAGAADRRAVMFAGQIKQNTRVQEDGKWRHLRNEEIRGYPWKWRIFQTWDFPAGVNPAYSFYKTGTYAHRLKLEQAKSPYRKSPYEREADFVRDFSGAFVAVKQGSYGAVLHTGPVGHLGPDKQVFQFRGPMGFGGGQLSAFWTPETGSVILGRRQGQNWDKSFDVLDDWRLWPIHAVSGATAAAKVFTSARIRVPAVQTEIEGKRATVKVHGTIPAEQLGQGKVLQGAITYTRVFRIEETKLHVTTTVRADGKDAVAELYETLPVFHQKDARGQRQMTKIEFQTDRKWALATTDLQKRVAAIRLTRFNGVVEIRFDKPQDVKLSPADWQDTHMTRAICRNVLIDLGGGGERSAAYSIAPAKYGLRSQP